MFVQSVSDFMADYEDAVKVALWVVAVIEVFDCSVGCVMNPSLCTDCRPWHSWLLTAK